MSLPGAYAAIDTLPTGQYRPGPGPWQLARMEDRWRWNRPDGAWVELFALDDGTAHVTDSSGRVTAFERFVLAHAEAWRRRVEL